MANFSPVMTIWQLNRKWASYCFNVRMTFILTSRALPSLAKLINSTLQSKYNDTFLSENVAWLLIRVSLIIIIIMKSYCSTRCSTFKYTKLTSPSESGQINIKFIVSKKELPNIKGENGIQFKIQQIGQCRYIFK